MKYQDKISPVKDYSVTTVMGIRDQTVTSKMVRSGKKARMEIAMEGMGMQAITIMDPDADGGKGAMFTLMPAMKTCVKMAIPPDAAPDKPDAKEPDIKIEELGKEQVDGVACDKRRVTITPADGKTQTMLVWLSPAAKNMPVKIEMTAPTAMIIKFKDYDFQKPSEDLFKVPADYKVTDMAQMMMNMR